jgi:hypothetical protein
MIPVKLKVTNTTLADKELRLFKGFTLKAAGYNINDFFLYYILRNMTTKFLCMPITHCTTVQIEIMKIYIYIYNISSYEFLKKRHTNLKE